MSGPKHRFDVGAMHQSRIDEARKRMKEIEEARPDDYFSDKEWQKLKEEVRQANISIEAYNRSRDMGAKF